MPVPQLATFMLTSEGQQLLPGRALADWLGNAGVRCPSDSVVSMMKSVHVVAQGARATWYGFYRGFGWFVSVFFIFSAVMTWYLGGRTARDRLALALVTWSLFLSHAAGSIIAWVYFFFAPILFSTVITVLLGIGCVRDWLAGRGTGADHNCEVGGSNPPSCPSEVINRNARLIRIVVQAPEGQRRYSPAECIGAVKHRVEANPDPKHV